MSLEQQARNHLKTFKIEFPGTFKQTQESEFIKFAGYDGDKRELCWLKCSYFQNHLGQEGLGITFGVHHSSFGERQSAVFWNDEPTVNDREKIDDDFALTLLRFEHADRIGKSKYLDKKKIDDCPCIKFEEGKTQTLVLVPAKNIFGQIVGIQEIHEIKKDKKDKFNSGQFRDAFFLLGELKGIVYLCEGFATAYSVWAASEENTVCCFGAGNMIGVGKAIKHQYPKVKLIIAGDSDVPGREGAEKARIALSAPVVYPSLKDFNDVYCRMGIEETKKQLAIPSYKAISFEKFMKMDIKPLEFSVENLFVEGSYNVIYSAPGVGKSRFLYELAWCCSLGCTFISFKPKKSMKVLYIDAEMTDSEVKAYWDDLDSRYKRKPKSLDIVTAEMLMSAGLGKIDLFDPESLQKLQGLFEGYDFIILDNLTHLIVPDDKAKNVNSIVPWRGVSAWMEQWRHKGTTIVAAHHTNKMGGMRDSGAISLDCQTVINLKPYSLANEELAPAYELHFDKGRHLIGEAKLPLAAKLVPSKDPAYPYRYSKTRIQPKKKRGAVLENEIEEDEDFSTSENF